MNQNGRRVFLAHNSCLNSSYDLNVVKVGLAPVIVQLLEQGVVAVCHYGLGHSMAACSCGWTGRRRYLKAAAEQDAWLHSIHEKCAVAVPLGARSSDA